MEGCGGGKGGEEESTNRTRSWQETEVGVLWLDSDWDDLLSLAREM